MALKKQERQALILDVLAHEVIDSQEDLMKYLQNGGYDVTQATISRDIKELRVVRRADKTGKSRYQVIQEVPVVEQSDVQSGIENMAQSITRVEFITSISTTPGNGNRLAALIDNANLAEVVSTVAGHDTIHILSPSVAAAISLADQFRNWLG
ncbi:ArgR family transcriptional regulator [Weissella diestrammenae]|uniref:Arginine repressor n=1 Tax=Weissella diestrammenae TaxID=1162633 RepID=A0A7G9T4E2_9LACO|nr:ArgR family transcriptional regulator [Weissella diestrammenae]MCM0583503.1 ArgR family transcriptional regulator [Weissella diestrammenae]QNN74967.1 ArgR family transcriptional regulator [Weissella diestrammenae]